LRLVGEEMMTRSEAENAFILCQSLVEVLGGDLREECEKKGIPKEYIDQLIQEKKESDKSYNKFFKEHGIDGEIRLSEKDTVLKLKNAGIKAGRDKEGNRWIIVPKHKKEMNSLEINFCKHLATKYGYKYWDSKN